MAEPCAYRQGCAYTLEQPLNDAPIIDPVVFAELQAAAGHDFVIELVQTFAEEAPTLLADLRRAQAAGDAERFRRAAHSLKSNSNTFGATRMAELARALELGGLPADAAPLDAIDAAYARALSVLQEAAGG